MKSSSDNLCAEYSQHILIPSLIPREYTNIYEITDSTFKHNLLLACICIFPNYIQITSIAQM